MKKAKTAPKKRPSGAASLVKIAAIIRDRINKADAGPTWRERSIAALASTDRLDGIIRSAQIQRDAGVMAADEAVFVIIAMADQLTSEAMGADAELKRISKAIAAAEKKHGLKDDEYWPAGEAPKDVEKLRKAWDRRHKELNATVLRRYGENDLADKLKTDKAALWDQVGKGRARIFGPLPDDIVKIPKGLKNEDKEDAAASR